MTAQARQFLGPGPYLFLSPHLDDVALSCSALVAELAPHHRVTVATFFTEAPPPPHTLSARAFLRQCGATGAQELYADRRAEDQAVMGGLGVDVVHLGLTEALFRERAGGATAGRLPWPPMFTRAYPTYRYHVVRGPIPRRDRHTVEAVGERLLDWVGRSGARTVVAPMGVGGHADHRIVADRAERLLPDAVFYADLPYALSMPPDSKLVRRRGLVGLSHPAGVDKAAVLAGYRSQVDALFPDGGGAPLDECYYVPRSRLRVSP